MTNFYLVNINCSIIFTLHVQMNVNTVDNFFRKISRSTLYSILSLREHYFTLDKHEENKWVLIQMVKIHACVVILIF